MGMTTPGKRTMLRRQRMGRTSFSSRSWFSEGELGGVASADSFASIALGGFCPNMLSSNQLLQAQDQATENDLTMAQLESAGRRLDVPLENPVGNLQAVDC